MNHLNQFMSRRILRTCVAGAAVLCLGASSALGSSDNTLLGVLEQMRSIALAAAQSGGGRARIAHHAEFLVVNRKVRDEPLHPATFTFSRGSSSLKNYSPDGKQLVGSFLWTEDMMAHYYGGPSPIPVSVLVVPRHYAVNDPTFAGYSFANIARIPDGLKEKDFFRTINGFTGMRVNRVGNLIQLREHDDLSKSGTTLLSEEYDYDFDMLFDGMIVKFKHIRVGRTDKKKIETTTDQRSWTWGRDGSTVVPVSYTANVSDATAGKVTYGDHIAVTFTSVHVSGKPRSPLTLDDMGIPQGTPVEDDVRRLRWKYFKGSGAAALGNGERAKGTTAPSEKR